MGSHCIWGRPELKRKGKSIIHRTSKCVSATSSKSNVEAADVQWPQCQERRQSNKPQVAPANKLASASALLALRLGVLGFFSNAARGRGRAGKA